MGLRRERLINDLSTPSRKYSHCSKRSAMVSFSTIPCNARAQTTSELLKWAERTYGIKIIT